MPTVFAQCPQNQSVRAMTRAVRNRTTHSLAASVIMIAVSSPATADAPRTSASGMVCSLNGRFCAFRTEDARFVEIRGQTDKSMRRPWIANVVSPKFVIGDNGRSLVELGPGLNLVDRNAKASTIVLIFHRPGGTVAPLRLRDISLDPARLPVTVSHRAWARAYGYDGRGSFVVETYDGRRLRFDPATGRRI